VIESKRERLFEIGNYYVIAQPWHEFTDYRNPELPAFLIRYQPDPGTSYQVATAPDMIQAVAKAMELHDALPDPNKLKVQ
jgi:hypothetical protein